MNNKKNYLSFITEMELLGSPQLGLEEEKKIQSFLSECFVIEMNQQIKLSAIQIRKRTGLKLPDSIIAASAEYTGIFLLTADTDFIKLKSLSILQYKKL
ncbi:MAG: PIN domain-containing protein [Ginsengibacter sp.]